eukprot:4678-Eustigmatos_ZCMA.PRE.1
MPSRLATFESSMTCKHTAHSMQWPQNNRRVIKSLGVTVSRRAAHDLQTVPGHAQDRSDALVGVCAAT